MKPVATDFQKIIHDARERKRNELLANQIFSRDRRQSAPPNLKTAPGGSLASRVGIKKAPQIQRAATAPRRSSLPVGNVHGDWTHDLHDSINGSVPRGPRGSLAARASQPGTSMRPSLINRPVVVKRSTRIASAMDRMDTTPALRDQVTINKPVPSLANKGSMGMTIRGLAGPFAVLAQNFAPGTTEADIENAMKPVGGEIVSCNFVKTRPIMIVEMVFASREGAERVIETFNDMTADGRLIKVYPKIGGAKPTGPVPTADIAQKPRNAGDLIVDGTAGFPEPRSGTTRTRALYSDRLAADNRGNRGRGRGGR